PTGAALLSTSRTQSSSPSPWSGCVPIISSARPSGGRRQHEKSIRGAPMAPRLRVGSSTSAQLKLGTEVMPSGFASLLRAHLEKETAIIRKRDPLLAQCLDCPVPQIQTTPERLRRGSDLLPGCGLEMVLRQGWSTPEEWGVWSLGRRAVVQ